jgi:predicted RNA binding protein YcfA (HicA-like mRNA interferase family)
VKKIPRDLTGPELAKALRALGYERVRQDGSHIRMTTQLKGEHHATVPNHRPIKIGTLRGILKDVAVHHGLSIDEMLDKINL